MKFLSELYKSLQSQEFNNAQFNTEEGKKNVLFVDPIMGNFDFYTMIVPYFCLEETNKYKTAMTGMYRFSEMENKPITQITPKQLLWADVVVIPMSLESFWKENELFNEMRALKPSLKIIQTVEFDYYELNKEHYLLNSKEITKEISRFSSSLDPKKITELVNAKYESFKSMMISQFESNLMAADRLLVLNHNLQQKLSKKGFLDVKHAPILINDENFKENVDFMDTLGIKNTPNIVFMSCELNKETKSAFKDFLPVFRILKKSHGNQFRLVIIGDSPIKHFPKFDIDADHLSKGSIIHQFKTIVKSSADFHLVLNKNNKYSSNSSTLFNFIDRGMFGIPVASLPVSPLKDIINHNQNGFILENRESLIELVAEIMKDKNKVVSISETLKASIIHNSEINESQIDNLGQLFFNYD